MASTEAVTSDIMKIGKRKRESPVDGYRSNDEDELTQEHVCNISSLVDMCIPVVAKHADLQDVVAKLPQHLVQRVSEMQKESVAYLMALGRTLKSVEKLHPSGFGFLVKTLSMINIPQRNSEVHEKEACNIRKKWACLPQTDGKVLLDDLQRLNPPEKQDNYTIRVSEEGQYCFRKMPSTSPDKHQKLLSTIEIAIMLERFAEFFGKRDDHQFHPASEFRDISRQLCAPLICGMKCEYNVYPVKLILMHKLFFTFIRFQYDDVVMHLHPRIFKTAESEAIADANELFNFVMSEKLQSKTTSPSPRTVPRMQMTLIEEQVASICRPRFQWSGR